MLGAGRGRGCYRGKGWHDRHNDFRRWLQDVLTFTLSCFLSLIVPFPPRRRAACALLQETCPALVVGVVEEGEKGLRNNTGSLVAQRVLSR